MHGWREGGRDTLQKRKKRILIAAHTEHLPNFGCMHRIQHLVYHTTCSSSAYNRVSDRRASDSCCACVRNDLCKFCPDPHTHKLVGPMEMRDIYTNAFYDRDVLRTRYRILCTYNVVRHPYLLRTLLVYNPGYLNKIIFFFKLGDSCVCGSWIEHTITQTCKALFECGCVFVFVFVFYSGYTNPRSTIIIRCVLLACYSFSLFNKTSVTNCTIFRISRYSSSALNNTSFLLCVQPNRHVSITM